MAAGDPVDKKKVSDDLKISVGVYSKVELTVTARTTYGQSIFMMLTSCTKKNDKECCEPPQYAQMVTTPETWPEWKTLEPLLLLPSVEHRYKYGILQDGCFDSWEFSSSEHRFIEHRAGSEIAIKDVFGKMRESTPTSVEKVDPPLVVPRNVDMLGVKSSSSLFIVCFHLPVCLEKDEAGNWTASWSESLIARTKDSIADDVATRWVGTVSTTRIQQRELTLEDQDSIRAVLQDMNCTPLFVPDETCRGAYYGYCKQFLWPSFHNVDTLDLTCACWNPDHGDPSSTWDQGNTEDWWKAYQSLNQAFYDELSSQIREDDVIWVHDYHLMLLPGMLSSKRSGQKNVHIIFFLHIPFPTSQIFRSLTHGHELLRGIMGADAVGFHAFDHARHFLNACKRLMGASHQSARCGLTGVEYCGRTVTVLVRCVSIEHDKIEEAWRHLEATDDSHLVESSEAKLPAKPTTTTLAYSTSGSTFPSETIVISGVDSCQRLSGVALKLLAFERFLWDFKKKDKTVVLIQYVLREGKRPADEARTASELRRLADRINASHPGSVLYRERHASQFRLDDRLRLWRSSSVLVGTAIREGLNLAPFEYLYCRQPPVSPGVVLASEFSATCSLLNGAIRLNPFDIAAVAAAFDTAIRMPEEERTRRCARDLPYLMGRHSGNWTRQILNDALDGSDSNKSFDAAALLNKNLFLPKLNESCAYGSLTSLHCESIDIPIITRQCEASTQRIFLLDYGGTLVRRGEQLGKYLKRNLVTFKSARTQDSALSVLEQLSTSEGTSACVISGMNVDAVAATLGHLPCIGLVASNGLCYSPRPRISSRARSERGRNSLTSLRRCWCISDYQIDWLGVKRIAVPILKRYTARTNGSSILSRKPGVAWSYYRTDPEWGRIQATELQRELEARLRPHDVEVKHVDGMIEIIPRRLHKGKIIHRLMDTYTSLHRQPDFVFSAGDGSADEHMFSALNSSCNLDKVHLHQICTCTVGRKPSRAAWWCNDTTEVRTLTI